MCQHHSETMAPAPLLINGFQIYYSWNIRESVSQPFPFLHKMKILVMIVMLVGSQLCPWMVTDLNDNSFPGKEISRLFQKQCFASGTHGQNTETNKKIKEYRKYRGTLALGREVCKCKYSCKSS